jgi:sugar-specific transcriptional regulator TrmB
MTEVEARSKALLEEAAKSSLDDIRRSLRELGITGYAADTFCALVRLPESTAGELVVKTGIPDSKIYYALEELAQQGLVEVQNGKPKMFRVSPTDEVGLRLREVLKNKFERQTDEINRLVLTIEPLRVASKSPSTNLAYVVKGETNVLARARSMIASARKEITLMTSDEGFFDKLEENLTQAARKKVKLRVALPSTHLDTLLANYGEIRPATGSFVLLIVDGQQILTARNSPGGNMYAITSTDETLVRIASEYWNNPSCCIRAREQSASGRGQKAKERKTSRERDQDH